MSLTDLAQTSQSWAQRTHQPHPRPEGEKTANQVPAFPSAPDGLATGRNVRCLQAFLWQEWEEKPKPPALWQLASSEPGGQHGVPRHPRERQLPGWRGERGAAQRGHKVAVPHGTRRRSLPSPSRLAGVARPGSPVLSALPMLLLPLTLQVPEVASEKTLGDGDAKRPLAPARASAVETIVHVGPALPVQSPPTQSGTMPPPVQVQTSFCVGGKKRIKV